MRPRSLFITDWLVPVAVVSGIVLFALLLGLLVGCGGGGNVFGTPFVSVGNDMRSTHEIFDGSLRDDAPTSTNSDAALGWCGLDDARLYKVRYTIEAPNPVSYERSAQLTLDRDGVTQVIVELPPPAVFSCGDERRVVSLGDCAPLCCPGVVLGMTAGGWGGAGTCGAGSFANWRVRVVATAD